MLNFDALGIALKRFSTLLTRTLEKNPSQRNSLKIGTYTPYGAVPETCKCLLLASVHSTDVVSLG